MTTKIFYLPRNSVSRIAINTVVNYIPCSFPEYKDMISADIIKLRITCRASNMKIVEQILRRYGCLE